MYLNVNPALVLETELPEVIESAIGHTRGHCLLLSQTSIHKDLSLGLYDFCRMEVPALWHIRVIC